MNHLYSGQYHAGIVEVEEDVLDVCSGVVGLLGDVDELHVPDEGERQREAPGGERQLAEVAVDAGERGGVGLQLGDGAREWQQSEEGATATDLKETMSTAATWASLLLTSSSAKMWHISAKQPGA
jgi:hypothetical protein